MTPRGCSETLAVDSHFPSQDNITNSTGARGNSRDMSEMPFWREPTHTAMQVPRRARKKSFPQEDPDTDQFSYTVLIHTLLHSAPKEANIGRVQRPSCATSALVHRFPSCRRRLLRDSQLLPRALLPRRDPFPRRVDDVPHHLLPIRDCGGQYFDALLDLLPRLHLLLELGVLHSVGVERLLPPFLDPLDRLHGQYRLPHEGAVVLDGAVPSLLEFERRVHRHLLPPGLAVRLRPGDLPRIALLVEGTVAFRAAESELLRVIPDEDYSVAGVARGRAEVALFDPHGCC
mmetsp:Transcript_43382/g.131975  ORF Transcript_43382/g.131975 Transcript_43382/m.131975 type:complete len:288 (-) Transcript_43382:144-1007(-)